MFSSWIYSQVQNANSHLSIVLKEKSCEFWTFVYFLLEKASVHIVRCNVLTHYFDEDIDSSLVQGIIYDIKHGGYGHLTGIKIHENIKQPFD